MSTVSIQPMTREMCHEFYKGFQNDPAIGHYYEYIYTPEIADRYFDINSVSDRRMFAILADGQIVGECKLKYPFADWTRSEKQKQNLTPKPIPVIRSFLQAAGWQSP